MNTQPYHKHIYCLVIPSIFNNSPALFLFTIFNIFQLLTTQHALFSKNILLQCLKNSPPRYFLPRHPEGQLRGGCGNKPLITSCYTFEYWLSRLLDFFQETGNFICRTIKKQQIAFNLRLYSKWIILFKGCLHQPFTWLFICKLWFPHHSISAVLCSNIHSDVDDKARLDLPQGHRRWEDAATVWFPIPARMEPDTRVTEWEHWWHQCLGQCWAASEVEAPMGDIAIRNVNNLLVHHSSP